jgi:DNA-binding GntR family transcriptional regulator
MTTPSGNPPSAPAIEHKLLSRTVADWLAREIVAGEYAPGERLFENRVAERAGVSRSPVREALRLLAAEGLIEIVPRFGAQVAYLTAADATDLYACRVLIEPPCVREAVQALPEGDVAPLEEARRQMEDGVAAGDSQGFLAGNVRYNRELVARCPNELLRDLVEQTWNKSLRYWSLLVRLPHYIQESLEHHRVLHDAVRRRDGERAATADREILEFALGQMLSNLEHAPAPPPAAATGG